MHFLLFAGILNVIEIYWFFCLCAGTVTRTSCYESTLFRLCLSVIKFPGDLIINFFWYYTWKLIMMSSYRQSQIFWGKKIGITNLSPIGPKAGSMRFFTFFLSSDHVFLWIAYDDSLRQFLTSSRDKTHKIKFWEPKFGWNGPKLDPKLGFSLFSQFWFISCPLNCTGW